MVDLNIAPHLLVLVSAGAGLWPMRPELGLNDLAERTAIENIIAALSKAMDEQDWLQLQSYLAPEIEVDYCDFRGTPVSRVTPEVFVAGRREALAGLRTQHVNASHEVRIEGDQATCMSAYRTYRLDPQRAPEPHGLESTGHFRYRLVRGESGWKVNGIVQTVVLLMGQRPGNHSYSGT